jgi:CBS domain-containing protein
MLRTSDIAGVVRAGRPTLTLEELIRGDGSASKKNVNDIELVHMHGDQPLGQALARMGETRHTVLPVVSRGNVRLLLGIVTLSDVLRAFGVERLDQLSPSDVALDE